MAASSQPPEENARTTNLVDEEMRPATEVKRLAEAIIDERLAEVYGFELDRFLGTARHEFQKQSGLTMRTAGQPDTSEPLKDSPFVS
jgi:hypothetical protein